MATEDDLAVVEERPRGIYVPIAPLDELREREIAVDPPLACEAPRIIYMNRDGGVYTPGSNNSSTNRSSIISGTASIPAWSVSDSSWNAIMDCMRDMYAPFNIEITDVDPGDIPHVESVVAGHPSDLGFSSGVGGVSPFSCGVIERSIVFTFAEIYGSVQAVCETAAQETAHSYGLDHEYLCQDPMTYLSGCGPKSFQDVDAQCGEFSARSCSCGGPTQNSVELLTARLGAACDPPDDPPGDPDAGVPVPGDPDAGAPAPGDPDAGVPEPGAPDAGVPEPGAPGAGVPEPGDPDPGNPGTDEPGDGDGEQDGPDLVGGCSVGANGHGSFPAGLLVVALLAVAGTRPAAGASRAGRGV